MVPDRFMWLLPDRVLYVGLLGVPARRTLGGFSVYVAPDGGLRVRVAGGAWAGGNLAVVPPWVPHEVAVDGRVVRLLQVEAETVPAAGLPAPLQGCGIVRDAGFVERFGAAMARLHDARLEAPDFDTLFFGAPLPQRPMDPRVRQVVDTICSDPAAAPSAEDCARSVGLSFSRFLHLFRQEVGVPFRVFRGWKRARGLLHHVHRSVGLAHVAQDAGYPDSSHFSHSIRQAYGLKPRDIFAGSRRLAVYAPGRTEPGGLRGAG